ncbi:unnamed protein product [Prorocentrum cordatum]|uniref:Peptidylprolyl isomerase n=1 Tax=Prorocentrum cordatum TaxID=2364126 RepID=A0ABN9TP73_9DINO|nr:unnamed protein product [Polarella glacialis]
MSNTGKNSNTCQFFIAFGELKQLNGTRLRFNGRLTLLCLTTLLGCDLYERSSCQKFGNLCDLTSSGIQWPRKHVVLGRVVEGMEIIDRVEEEADAAPSGLTSVGAGTYSRPPLVMCSVKFIFHSLHLLVFIPSSHVFLAKCSQTVFSCRESRESWVGRRPPLGVGTRETRALESPSSAGGGDSSKARAGSPDERVCRQAATEKEGKPLLPVVIVDCGILES